MDVHDRAVAAIATSVQKFYTEKKAFRIYHGSTNSTRKSPYRRSNMVDTSGLSNVLKVDTQSKTALVEPNVPMDSLVEATLKHGMIPPVVMEFPGITVGGGFAGTAGESSSFRYGFFDRTINWIEIVLANGEVVKASSTEREDLFLGAASSFGTLGVTTLLEIQLIEAKTYVELTYFPVSSVSEAQKRIDEAIADTAIEYLDGIMYAQDRGVVCAGRLTNTVNAGVKVQGFTKPRDPWFYIHTERLIQEQGAITPIKETIPIVDYLFRYDRGGFWVARYAFKYFITPFNRITRFLLDYFMHTRVMYHALHQSGLSDMYVIQDVAIPPARAAEFMVYLGTHFKNYPIWLCPLKQSGRGVASTHSLQADKRNGILPEYVLNFGVWGPGPTKPRDFVEWNRAFEQKVHSLGGQKWLYAHAYYTEKEFDEIYNGKEYYALREKYHATHLPTVYDKVKVDIDTDQKRIQESWKYWLLAVFWSIWPLRGLYGVYKAMMGGEYLLPKNSQEKIS